MLYEMLAGNPPHTGSSAQQIIMKIITEQPAAVTQYRKSVPPNVAAAVAKALEKLPADRFDSAAKLAEALGNPAFAHHAGVPGSPDGVGVRHPWNRITVGLAAIAAVLTVLLGATTLSHRGCCRFAVTSISERNRSTPTTAPRSGLSTLRATFRLCRTSRARYTIAIPPSPTRRSMV
jgi:serine/threonine protein kinase